MSKVGSKAGEPDTQALRPCIQSRTMCGPEAARKLWVEALRSGRYRQHRRGLSHIENGDCCLGVACKVYIEAGGVLERVVFADIGGDVGYRAPGERDEFYLLPKVVQEWLGLVNCRGQFVPSSGQTDNLMRRNDVGCSFQEIADLIESVPDGLLRSVDHMTRQEATDHP